MREHKDAVIIVVLSDGDAYIYDLEESLKDVFENGPYADDCFDNVKELPAREGLYLCDLEINSWRDDYDPFDWNFKAYLKNIRPCLPDQVLLTPPQGETI